MMRERGDFRLEAKAFLRNFRKGAVAIIIFWTIALVLIYVVTWSHPPLDKMIQIVLVSAALFGIAVATYLLFFRSPWAPDAERKDHDSRE
jgi:hypothetical protein